MKDIIRTFNPMIRFSKLTLIKIYEKFKGFSSNQFGEWLAKNVLAPFGKLIN